MYSSGNINEINQCVLLQVIINPNNRKLKSTEKLRCLLHVGYLYMNTNLRRFWDADLLL